MTLLATSSPVVAATLWLLAAFSVLTWTLIVVKARARWQACGIPDALSFRTEPELALEMVGELVARAEVPFRWVTADEHFGQNPGFLDGVAELGKWYLAEVPADTRVWLKAPPVEPPGRGPLGHPRTRPRVAQSAPSPRAVRDLCADLPAQRWTPPHHQRRSQGRTGGRIRVRAGNDGAGRDCRGRRCGSSSAAA